MRSAVESHDFMGHNTSRTDDMDLMVERSESVDSCVKVCSEVSVSVSARHLPYHKNLHILCAS